MTDAKDQPSRSPEIRVADSDREEVAEQLREAAAVGRLDFTELDERLTQVYEARTRTELQQMTADLPAAAAASAEPLELRTKSGTIRKEGHWPVPDRITAECTSGSIKFDFTQAVCPHREVHIQASAKSGSVVFVVPRGWRVDLDRATATSGSVVNKVTDAPRPNAPLLRVTGEVRSGVIKARYPRRTFWQWLLRRPRP